MANFLHMATPREYLENRLRHGRLIELNAEFGLTSPHLSD